MSGLFCGGLGADEMANAVLTISSKNYSSWSLRGWLLCKMAGLKFEEMRQSIDDPGARAELLLLSPSFLTPALDHQGLHVWDTLAMAEYLHEVFPKAGILPADRAARTHNRSVSGEMHSGFSNLRSALPMNIKAFSRTSGSGRGPSPISSASAPSGATASANMAAPSCSAPSRRSPTPCSRRSPRASPPITSRSTRNARAFATISSTGRRWSNGPRPRKSSRTKWKNSTSNFRTTYEKVDTGFSPKHREIQKHREISQSHVCCDSIASQRTPGPRPASSRESIKTRSRAGGHSW